MLHFPCAAGVVSVVEVGTACRHGRFVPCKKDESVSSPAAGGQKVEVEYVQTLITVS